jgi:hypothetical protein
VFTAIGHATCIPATGYCADASCPCANADYYVFADACIGGVCNGVYQSSETLFDAGCGC